MTGYQIIPGAQPGDVHPDYRSALLAREAALTSTGYPHHIVEVR